MKLISFTLLIATAPLFAQSVIYDLTTANEAGLSAFTSQHPSFSEHFNRIKSKSYLESTDGLESLFFILRNDSAFPINYISIRYTYTFKDGSIHHGAEVLEPSTNPGDTFLISQMSTVVGPEKSRNIQKDVDQYKQLLSSCSSVKISLDAVQLANGQIVGPDEGGLRVRINAEKRASDELRNSTHSKIYLEYFKKAPRVQFSVELGNNQPEYWYVEARRKIATHLLEGMK